jgi:hypothetical protein
MSHNFNTPRDPWSRLTAAARKVPDDRETSAPYGFATRIAALAFAQEQRMASLFDRFAFRAVGVASLLAVFSVALNYDVITTASVASTTVARMDEGELLIPKDDAVAIVLDLAD